MPRRNPFATRNVRSTTAPKPIKVKAPKLEPDSLQECYQWLNFDRIMGFNLILDWYATNTPKLLFGAPLPPDQMSTFNKAEKAYRLGCSTDQTGEREQAFRTAIRCYERVFQEQHKLPAFQEDAPPAANRRTTAMAATLQTLNAAFGGIGMKFVPTPKPEREFINGVVQVPMAQLSTMAESGLMAAAFSEFVSAVKCASLVPDPDPANNGALRLDGAKLFSESIPKALEGLLHWAESVPPKELFRKRTLGSAPKAAAVAGPKVPRAPRQSVNGAAAITPLVTKNPCKAGTFCYAQVEAILQSSTVAEAQSKLDASGLNPGKRKIEIAWLTKKGYISLGGN